MARMMCVATPKVKPTRRTIRMGDRFGAGILRFVPYPVTYPGHFEPSEADRAWAAEHLNADDPDWDAMAAESGAIDRMERGIAPT